MNYETIRIHKQTEKMLVGHYQVYLADYYRYYRLMKSLGAKHPREVPENEEVADWVEKLKSKEAFFLMEEFKGHSPVKIMRQVQADLEQELAKKRTRSKETQYERLTFMLKIIEKKLEPKLVSSGTFWQVFL